jgi:hypothetical protein
MMDRLPSQTEDHTNGRSVQDRETAWAAPASKFKVSGVPAGAINLNVEGRQLTGPLQGFGQLWQKTYKIRLSGSSATPPEVIRVWKQEFPNFWPKGNRFYGPLTGIKPGEVAVLNLAGPGGITGPGGAPMISTGVMVIYADDESFSFMTPEGHMFAAMITFSAFEEDDSTVVQIQALIRANDPLYELGLRLGLIHKTEDEFWHQTLKNLAARFNVTSYVQQDVAIIDPKVQWSQAKNIWKNAAIRTGIYYLTTPFRWIGKLFKR